MIEEHKRKVIKEIDEICGAKIVCDKCGKIYEVSVPQISILRDFHKEK